MGMYIVDRYIYVNAIVNANVSVLEHVNANLTLMVNVCMYVHNTYIYRCIYV